MLAPILTPPVAKSLLTGWSVYHCFLDVLDGLAFRRAVTVLLAVCVGFVLDMQSSWCVGDVYTVLPPSMLMKFPSCRRRRVVSLVAHSEAFSSSLILPPRSYVRRVRCPGRFLPSFARCARAALKSPVVIVIVFVRWLVVVLICRLCLSPSQARTRLAARPLGPAA